MIDMFKANTTWTVMVIKLLYYEVKMCRLGLMVTLKDPKPAQVDYMLCYQSKCSLLLNLFQSRSSFTRNDFIFHVIVSLFWQKHYTKTHDWANKPIRTYSN